MPKVKNPKAEKPLTRTQEREAVLAAIAKTMKKKNYAVIVLEGDANKGGISISSSIHDMSAYKLAASCLSLVLGKIPADKRILFCADVSGKAMEIAAHND